VATEVIRFRGNDSPSAEVPRRLQDRYGVATNFSWSNMSVLRRKLSEEQEADAVTYLRVFWWSYSFEQYLKRHPRLRKAWRNAERLPSTRPLVCVLAAFSERTPGLSSP
jgi:hypothetical protein